MDIEDEKDSSRGTRSLVLSYLTLRKAVGILGLGLPFVLAAGKELLQGPGIEPSISAYYYTSMGDVFVGTLCAIGVFMFSYRGYERSDAIAGKLACLFAVGTALLPTIPPVNSSHTERITGMVHYTFAVGFFIVLAYFSLVLFRKTDPTKPTTKMKRWRNRVYAACGSTILACIALLAAYAAIGRGTALDRLNPVFWLESLAVLMFGLSWFVKGEAILADTDSP